jgi:hypothetical protein
MFDRTHRLAAIGSLLLATAGPASATVILDTTVTSTFGAGVTTTGTGGNDLPQPRPSTLYYGQLRATQQGYVDFFYVGNEAGFTNTLSWGNSGNLLSGTGSHSTAALPDNFNSPHPFLGSISVMAGALLDFGFCTSGGDSVGAFGRCAHNDSAASLTAQYNHNRVDGYRSIGYRSLTAYDYTNGQRTFGTNGPSDLWMIFWDDAGARNDDNHDDYIAVASFRPKRVSVPEPGSLALLGLGLAGAAGALRRRQTRAG